MVEPAALLFHPLREEAKRRARPIDRGRPRHPPTVRSDAEASQAEAHSSNAADIPRIALHR